MTARIERRWRLHGILVALALLQLIAWLVVHRTGDEWQARWHAGTAVQRLQAGHVLLNRGPAPPGFLADGAAVEELLGDPDPRVRSLAFTSDACKLAPASPQLSAIVQGLEAGSPAAFVDFVLQCRKVGGQSVGSSNAMKRREVAWYFRARKNESWPGEEADQINQHLAPWLSSIHDYLERN